MVIEPMSAVIVGVDGSSASTAAVDLAAEEAAARVAPLVVVHAISRHEDVEDAQRLVATAVARARSEHPCLSVAGELRSGLPAEVLTDRARDGCLLVVGHRGRCGYGGHDVGSVAVRVAALSNTPVIIHRPLDHSVDVPQPRPVLAGLDPLTVDAVLGFALLEASLRGVPLLATPVPAGRGQARSIVDAMRVWSKKYPDVPVHWVVRRGLDVAVVLAAGSRATQLAVVGLTGAGSATRLLTGSVGQALIHRAGCPVAVVPVP